MPRCRASMDNVVGKQWACSHEFMSACVGVSTVVLIQIAQLKIAVKTDESRHKHGLTICPEGLGSPLKSRLACLHITYRSKLVQICLHVRNHTTRSQCRHIQKQCYCRDIHLKTAFAKSKAWEHTVKHMVPDEEHMLERVSILLNCISWANSSPYTTSFPCTPGGHHNMCWLAFPVGIQRVRPD